jgi:hypothetical protein
VNQATGISFVIDFKLQKVTNDVTTEGYPYTVLPKRLDFEKERELRFRKERQDRNVHDDLLNVFKTEFVNRIVD